MADQKEHTKQASSFKRRLAIVAAVVVPVVTAATIVIPIVADSFERPTSIDALEYDAPDASNAPVENLPTMANLAASFSEPDGRKTYLIPLSAPFDTISLGGAVEGRFCSQAQLDWLEQHEIEGEGFGVHPDGAPVTLDLRNAATDGGSLSIRNLHAVADNETPEFPSVTMACDKPQGGFEWPQRVEIDFSTGDPAAWGSPDYMDVDPEVEGTVFSLNLAPGESAQILLGPHWPDRSFNGRLVADVTAAGVTAEVTMLDGIFKPYATTDVQIFLAGSELFCSSRTRSFDCTPSGMMSLAGN
ncbi:MAG: hypothetical protein ACOH10_02245 [Rhodoglobus sp.]